MDSFLTNKIKIVYDKWIEFNGQKQYLPNGVHPEVFDIIQEKANISQNLHQAIDDTKKEVSGPIFTYDHSNFWGYTTNLIDFIDVETIDVNLDIVYIFPLDLKSPTLQGDELFLHRSGRRIKNKLHETFSSKLFDLFKSGKVKILLNFAHDPISELTHLQNIEKYFNYIGIDCSNVIFVPGNDCKKQFLENNTISKLKISPAPLLLTHQASITMSQYPMITNLGYTSDIVREEDIKKTIIRKSKFLCLNRTMKPHRYMMAYYALKNNLLSTNYFSFLNSFNASYDSIRQALSRFNLLTDKELDKFGNNIKNILPYHLDTQSFNEEERCGMTWTNNRKDLYLNSYINIVTETSFEEMGNPFISEKLWKPIMNLQPFIVLGDHNTLKFIRELGFKTFSPFIDERYDEIYDKNLRLKLIFKELDKLTAMPTQEIHEWYHSIIDTLIHNKKQLESLKATNPYQGVFSDLINTYSKDKNGF